MVSQPASYQTSDRSEKNESEFELSLKKLMVKARRVIPQKDSSKSLIHLLHVPIRYLGMLESCTSLLSFLFFFFSFSLLFLVSLLLPSFLFLFSLILLGGASSFGEARLRLRLRLLRERKGPWKGRHCTVGTVLYWTGGWKSGRIPGSAVAVV